jgi:DNA-binding CsgD family transcriptional regulator
MRKFLSKIFKNQEVKYPQVETEMSALKDAVKRQEAWLSNLHKYSNDLHKYSNYIKESSVRHKSEVFEAISGISKWVDHLNRENRTLKEEVLELKAKIRHELKEDFKNYHETLFNYVSLRLDDKSHKEKLKEELLTELRSEIITFDAKKPKQGIINEESSKGINNVMHYNASIELTNPEKELLNLFFNENKPLTYETIAKKLNKSLNTVRVYMNSLKSKKEIIEEFITPNGTKVFSLKNSELVKTLFNIK